MRGRERELHYVGNTGHTVEPMLVLYGMSGGKWGYQNLAAGILLHWKGCVGVRPETQLEAASNRCFFNTWFSWGEGFPGGSVVEDPPIQETEETRVWSLGWENPLEEDMATHSSILAWEIPWTEEPGGLQSRGLQ